MQYLLKREQAANIVVILYYLKVQISAAVPA